MIDFRHTAPTGAVLDTATAKVHLRVDHNAEDALIDSLVVAATEEAEHLMQRAILAQKWQVVLPQWPCDLRLPRPRVTAIDSITYIDGNGAAQVLSPSAYQWIGDDYKTLLAPAYGASWPAARCQLNAITIVYSTGWANAAAVPELVKAWIKLYLTALYENRSAWTEGRRIEPNEHTKFMLDRWTVFTL